MSHVSGGTSSPTVQPLSDLLSLVQIPVSVTNWSTLLNTRTRHDTLLATQPLSGLLFPVRIELFALNC